MIEFKILDLKTNKTFTVYKTSYFIAKRFYDKLRRSKKLQLLSTDFN